MLEYSGFIFVKRNSIRPYIVVVCHRMFENYDVGLYRFHCIINGNRIWLVWFMVLNVTFNNISVISWWSILLMEETGVPRESHQPVASHWQTVSHNVVLNTPCNQFGFELTTLVALITQVIVKPTNIWSRSCRPHCRICNTIETRELRITNDFFMKNMCQSFKEFPFKI